MPRKSTFCANLLFVTFSSFTWRVDMWDILRETWWDVKRIKIQAKENSAMIMPSFCKKTSKQKHCNHARYQIGLMNEQFCPCAKHFATPFHNTNPTPANQDTGTTCIIFWQGNSISAVKTFTAKNCAMCANGRITILKQSRSNPQLLLKSDDTICNACRHRPHFQGHVKHNISSADKSQSMTKEPAQHTKLPLILLSARFA
mgnify:CR=1 FL=1